MPRLSSMIRDPYVRAAFERAERDGGHDLALSATDPHRRDGGAAEELRTAETRSPMEDQNAS